MKNMTLERITEVCGGVYYGSEADKKKEIAGAVIDSRQVESGYLFIAVKGEKVDGHQFIPQVFEKVHLPYYLNRNCQIRRALISGWNRHLVQ